MRNDIKSLNYFVLFSLLPFDGVFQCSFLLNFIFDPLGTFSLDILISILFLLYLSGFIVGRKGRCKFMVDILEEGEILKFEVLLSNLIPAFP